MNRGEIWLVNLDPTIGDEIKKTRPVIIVNDDDIGRLNLRVVVPITGWQNAFDQFPWMARLDPDDKNGLSKTSAADAFQVRTLSTTRFINPRGNLSSVDMKRVTDTLIVTLGLDP